MKNPEMTDVQNKLSIVLKEYEALRDEIIKCSDRQIQLFQFLIIILSFAYGTIVAYGDDWFYYGSD